MLHLAPMQTPAKNRDPCITVTFRSVHPSEEFVRNVQGAARSMQHVGVLHVVIAEAADCFVVTAEMHSQGKIARHVARHEDARTAVLRALELLKPQQIEASATDASGSPSR